MDLTTKINQIATAIGNYVRDSIKPRLLKPGGTTGQVYKKNSAADYDASWVDASAALGANQVIEYVTSCGYGTVVTESYTDVCSITLTPGTWVLFAMAHSINYADSVTYFQMAGIVDGDSNVYAGAMRDCSTYTQCGIANLSISNFPVTIAETTTFTLQLYGGDTSLWYVDEVSGISSTATKGAGGILNHITALKLA